MISIPFKNFVIERLPILPNAEEIKPLHTAHYQETESRYKHHTVAVDYEYMGKCEDEGRMVCFGARLVDSEQLVAYLFFWISRSVHDGALNALEDAFYIVPEHRGSGLARRLLNYAENRLKELKVDYVFMSSKDPVGGPHLKMFFESMDYKQTAVVYTKAL